MTKNFRVGYACIVFLFLICVWDLFSLNVADGWLWWLDFGLTVGVIVCLCIDCYVIGKAKGENELLEKLED